MDKEFCFGLLLGGLVGALIATNVPKVQRFIKNKQDALTEKLKKEKAKVKSEINAEVDN